MKPLEQDGLAAVLAPIETARGLPNSFYTDTNTFRREQEVLFARNWSAIGFGKDIPEPGDARPLCFAGVPMFMVRDRDGHVRVFQNVCRHRGMTLVSEPARLKGVIRCPYHSWCYELDGALRSTPHVGGVGHNTHESIDRDMLGLLEVRSTVWMDMVFINLSGDAADFEEQHAKLIDRWRDFAGQHLHHGGAGSSLTFEVRCNWKLAVENYCESYHLPWVHPGLNSYSKLEDHYNIVEPGCFAGQGTKVYNPQLDDSGRRFANFPALPHKWDSAAEYVALFPNVLLGVHKDHFFSIFLEPVDVETTREHLEIYYADDAMCADAMSALRQAHAEAWREVFAEDVFPVEGMQAARHARDFDGGRFSPVMDTATHCFHRWVVERFS